MHAEEKIKGAEYHLNNMKKYYLRNEEYFIYEMEAFLAKARGILDVLLQDFNEKFLLGISLKKKLTCKNFENEAKKLNNIQALNFIKWYKDKMNFIKRSKVGFLLHKRNIAIHRKTIRPDIIKIEIVETIRIIEEVTITLYNRKSGEKVFEKKEISETPSSKPEIESKVELCFKEYPDKGVLEVCEELLQIIKDFVEEAVNKFN